MRANLPANDLASPPKSPVVAEFKIVRLRLSGEAEIIGDIKRPDFLPTKGRLPCDGDALNNPAYWNGISMPAGERSRFRLAAMPCLYWDVQDEK
jgi:hypothetical protein